MVCPPIFTDVLPLSGAGTGASIAAGGLTVLATMAYGIRESRHAEKTGQDEEAINVQPSGRVSPS